MWTAAKLILSFLQAYWKPLAIALLIGGIYVTGRIQGANNVREEWELVKKAQEIADLNATLRQQQKEKEAEESFLKIISKLRAEKDTLSRKLAYALNDPVYRTRPTIDGLRAVNETLKAAGNAATGN